MTARYYTVEQVAEALQLSPWAIRKMCRTGRLKARNVGTARRHIYRIPASELEAA